jgi:hypothetical protein
MSDTVVTIKLSVSDTLLVLEALREQALKNAGIGAQQGANAPTGEIRRQARERSVRLTSIIERIES